MQGVTGLPRKKNLTQQGSLPQQGKNERTPRDTEQRAQAQVGVMAGDEREGPAHQPGGSGFSEWADMKRFKAGEWPFLVVLIIKIVSVHDKMYT